jgi:hypothetical protein
MLNITYFFLQVIPLLKLIKISKKRHHDYRIISPLINMSLVSIHVNKKTHNINVNVTAHKFVDGNKVLTRIISRIQVIIYLSHREIRC